MLRFDPEKLRERPHGLAQLILSVNHKIPFPLSLDPGSSDTTMSGMSAGEIRLPIDAEPVDQELLDLIGRVS